MATRLSILDASRSHRFLEPAKRIQEVPDVSQFLVSGAYRDITIFLVQLNRAMFPRKDALKNDAQVLQGSTIAGLQGLLEGINELVNHVPLDPGSHRFGNTAFRKWHELLERSSLKLLNNYLPANVINFPHKNSVTSITELKAYLLGSFGSAQRLDYGTGHELSFLAFIAGIWKLGGFQQSNDGSEERSIVSNVINLYLAIVRKLILKYSLEPAGSHGVWGLDDHSFLPYIFGSAQYGPAITGSDLTPLEGSLPGTPDPGAVVMADVVANERDSNLYFGAIGFIYDVKKGPFWEHSPTLFDISGVRAGWAKINKGMLKMYNAEVLSKFPVVQHFPFGSLLSFDSDPEADAPPVSIHMASQSRQKVPIKTEENETSFTAAPWARTPLNSTNTTIPSTVLPLRTSGGSVPGRFHHSETRPSMPSHDSSTFGPTTAPWAKKE